MKFVMHWKKFESGVEKRLCELGRGIMNKLPDDVIIDTNDIFRSISAIIIMRMHK